MAQCIFEDWTEKAQSNTGWRAKLKEMIGRRKQKDGGWEWYLNGMTSIVVGDWISSVRIVRIMYDVAVVSQFMEN